MKQQRMIIQQWQQAKRRGLPQGKAEQSQQASLARHTLGPSWCHRYLDLTQAPRRANAVLHLFAGSHRQISDLPGPYLQGDRATQLG